MGSWEKASRLVIGSKFQAWPQCVENVSQKSTVMGWRDGLFCFQGIGSESEALRRY